MAKANGQYNVFNVTECYVALVSADDSSSTTGPTFGQFFKAPGIQKFTIKNKSTTVKQPGNGVGNYATEIYNEDAELSITFAGRNDDLFAKIFGTAFWMEPDKSTYSFSAGAKSQACCFIGKTNQIGKNGQEIWLRIYSGLIGGDGAGLEVQKFSTFELSGSAQFTQSTKLVYRDGSPVYEAQCWDLINYQTVTSVLGSVNSAAPVITYSISSGATNVSKTNASTFTSDIALNPNSVNPYTVYLEKVSDSSRATATIGLSTDGLTITLTPSTALAGSTQYRWRATVALETKFGVSLATEFTGTFTTAA